MKRLILLSLGLLLTLAWMPRSAQAQAATITLNVPVEGTITQTEIALAWEFTGWANQMVSFRVIGSDDLDPVISIRDQDDERIMRNDDFDYPNTRDALIEAVTLPANGRYQVIVSSYGGTMGDFVLLMMPGYSSYALDERFVSQENWDGDGFESVDVTDGIATLSVEGIDAHGVFIDDTMQERELYYAQLIVSDVQSRNDWAVGLAIHQQTNGDHYQVLINERGEWRVTAHIDGEQTVLREWVSHPGITAGVTAFTVSAYVNSGVVTVFYNEIQLGQVQDDTLDEGLIGITVQTANAINSDVTAAIDQLIITQPTEIETGHIIPEQLVSGSNRIAIQELVRRQVIGAGGRIAWEIAESFLETAEAGVSRLPLVEETRFNNFALGTTATLVPGGEGIAACGLLFGNTSDTDYYVAYLDNTGAYSLSQRTGDTFETLIYDEDTSWDIQEPSELIVVVYSGVAYFYVNRIYSGSTQVPFDNGQVGNVAINFETISSRCDFNDTWIWALD